jgi:hypothetical protein
LNTPVLILPKARRFSASPLHQISQTSLASPSTQVRQLFSFILRPFTAADAHFRPVSSPIPPALFYVHDQFNFGVDLLSFGSTIHPRPPILNVVRHPLSVYTAGQADARNWFPQPTMSRLGLSATVRAHHLALRPIPHGGGSPPRDPLPLNQAGFVTRRRFSSHPKQILVHNNAEWVGEMVSRSTAGSFLGVQRNCQVSRSVPHSARHADRIVLLTAEQRRVYRPPGGRWDHHPHRTREMYSSPSEHTKFL